MFSEWRKRSKLFRLICSGYSYDWIYKIEAYDLARAAFKAGVRAGIKQARKK